MARGHAVAWNGDANRNVTGRANTYQILNTRMHPVEFSGDKVTELTAKIIAESM